MAAMALLCIGGTAVAASKEALFEDGNRLFRDDLYWAALLRYGQAAEAGLDTPLLHYNTGIAHYRAGQHSRARRSLLDASRYPPLEAISHYNLGLNAYRAGDAGEALRWFRRARDQDSRPDISRLARRAIGQLEDERDSAAPAPVEVAIAARERRFTRFDFRARIGAGVDDNVYRSPSTAYVDLANPAQPLVTPIVQSGFYLPVSLNAKYQVNALEHEGFFASYILGGRFYQDTALENANEYLHEIAFGSEYRRRTENRERRVYSAFKIAQHHETYFDPDSGVERDIGGVSIADRMSYLRYGPEFWMRQTFGRFSIGGRAKGQLWNYEDAEVVPEYDNEYWLLGLNTQYRFTSTSLVRLKAEYYTRRFGDRTAFELDGSQPLGNPTIRYDYTRFGVEARQRVTSAMWFGIGYARTDRIDQHLGYNNYFRDDYGAEIHMRLGDRFDFEVEARYNIYNYENAFAFHEPTASRKTLETAWGRAIVSFRMTDSLELTAEYTYRDVVSNDTRIEYSRGQGLIGIRWQQ